MTDVFNNILFDFENVNYVTNGNDDIGRQLLEGAVQASQNTADNPQDLNSLVTPDNFYMNEDPNNEGNTPQVNAEDIKTDTNFDNNTGPVPQKVENNGEHPANNFLVGGVFHDSSQGNVEINDSMSVNSDSNIN